MFAPIATIDITKRPCWRQANGKRKIWLHDWWHQWRPAKMADSSMPNDSFLSIKTEIICSKSNNWYGQMPMLTPSKWQNKNILMSSTMTSTVAKWTWPFWLSQKILAWPSIPVFWKWFLQPIAITAKQTSLIGREIGCMGAKPNQEWPQQIKCWAPLLIRQT